jgi:tetratricopeptide (TPR) repeat protein
MITLRAIPCKRAGKWLVGITAALLLGAGHLALAQDEKALAAQYAAARQAGDWPQAERVAQQQVNAQPQQWEYRRNLALALLYAGKYQDAITAYQAAIPLAEAMSSSAARKATGTMYTEMGNAYLKLHKPREAIAAYNQAAPVSDNPAVAYFNICATAYNTGLVAEGLVACDQAIGADPRRADAYFVKGSLLLGKGTVGPGGKYIVPAGTAENLQKYLTLAPNGAHVNDVKQMLDALK